LPSAQKKTLTMNDFLFSLLLLAAVLVTVAAIG
jgi:hypothetical protein